MGFFSNIVPNELKGGGWITPAAATLGFLAGGPAGAAAGAGVSTKARGGSWGDALTAAGLGYLGGNLAEFGGIQGGEGFGGVGGFGSYGGIFNPSASTLGFAASTPVAGLPEWATIYGGGGGDSALFELMKKYGMKTGPFSNSFNALSGIIGLKQSRDARRLMEAASRTDAPFAGERGYYAGQLRALQENPDLLYSTPGFRAGERAVMRRMQSQGYTGSGNMATALAEHGIGALDKEAVRLANLAGAQFAPNVGSTMVAGNNSANDMLSKALASLGYSIRGFEDIFRNRDQPQAA